MSELRKEVEQALDEGEIYDSYGARWGKERIEALRAALVQPEKTNQCAETCERAKLCAVCASVVDDVNPEPVLWMMPDGKIVDKWALQFYGGQAGEPLYKAPLKRKPLTNGEIYTAYITATNQTLRAQDEKLALEFARAIERAHGIGCG